ncbi:hypothetical protein SAMN05443144_12738 [Fodinibius roseus]|uniref:Uncharacterized protein n=1 Tax=Fodinibius roseus TaxID=1194090 RepID=A0A1M5JJR1_9BACT|nr:hypothetical protein SAMN05443144_12738 [Fodinibius roseus]
MPEFTPFVDAIAAFATEIRLFIIFHSFST